MDTLRSLSGIPLDEERLVNVIEAYRPILSEIEKLRELNLKNTYPAINFNPSTAYTKRGDENE